MKKLKLKDVEPFFRWPAYRYKQTIPRAVDSMLAEEPAKQQLIAEFLRLRQPVQLELPLGE
jgi:hypothetical protein